VINPDPISTPMQEGTELALPTPLHLSRLATRRARSWSQSRTQSMNGKLTEDSFNEAEARKSVQNKAMLSTRSHGHKLDE